MNKREYCKRIALELEAYVNGHMYQDENGDTVYSIDQYLAETYECAKGGR